MTEIPWKMTTIIKWWEELSTIEERQALCARLGWDKSLADCEGYYAREWLTEEEFEQLWQMPIQFLTF